MMTLPNIITLSRIGLIPVFVGLFYLQPGYLEGAPLALINNGTPLPWINNALVVIFILISASDFVDGLLARKLNQISAFGAFLDPVADKLLVCVALILLTDYYHSWFITIPAIIIISREILVSALREWMSEVGKRAKMLLFHGLANQKHLCRWLLYSFFCFNSHYYFFHIIRSILREKFFYLRLQFLPFGQV